MNDTDTLETLICALDTTDLTVQRNVSCQILEFGADALPDLMIALRTGPPAVRKSSAYLLGQLKTPESVEALGQALLIDDEPKVRQNAAVALGKIKAPGGVSLLAEALTRETASWVRASIYLSLGAIGGPGVHQAISTSPPGDEPREREAHRKAWDRVATPERRVEWNPSGFGQLEILLEAPPGLEEVAQEEAGESGFALTLLRPGLLAGPSEVPPTDLIPRLRCVHGLLLPAGEGPALDRQEPVESFGALHTLFADSPLITGWRNWVRTEDAHLHYRFSIEGVPLRRDALRQILAVLREWLLPLGWKDSPSHYDVEMIVRCSLEETRLLIRPSFMKDDRFDYRVKDVGASIDPVVAACLARLARTSVDQQGVVFDPTCGSGTLLIERAMLDEEVSCVGLDISPTATAAARANLEAAGLSDRVEIRRGDSTRQENWPECREALANLPFGLRTRRESSDLEPLYDAIAAHLSERLVPGGRAVLYTAAKRQMSACLARHQKRIRVERQMKVLSGGLWVNIWVLAPRKRK